MPATVQDEPFDVVDARDEVIGRATRAEVHRRGWLHRAVHVLVFNAAGEVFLQQRAPDKDSDPGSWDSSAAGHLAAGEDYDACVPRELAEELGLVLARPAERLFKLGAGPDTHHEFVWVYRAEAEGPFALDPVEVADGAWFTLGQVDAWVRGRPHELTPPFRLLWARLRGWQAIGVSSGSPSARTPP